MAQEASGSAILVSPWSVTVEQAEGSTAPDRRNLPMPRRALGTVCQPATLGSLPEPETRGPSSPEEPSVLSQQQIRPSLASMATKDALRDLDPGWTKLRRREDDFLDSAPTRSRELTQGFPRLASSLRRGL